MCTVYTFAYAKTYTFAKHIVLHMQNYMFCLTYEKLHILNKKSDAHFMKLHVPLKLTVILFCLLRMYRSVGRYGPVMTDSSRLQQHHTTSDDPGKVVKLMKGASDHIFDLVDPSGSRSSIYYTTCIVYHFEMIYVEKGSKQF